MPGAEECRVAAAPGSGMGGLCRAELPVEGHGRIGAHGGQQPAPPGWCVRGHGFEERGTDSPALRRAGDGECCGEARPGDVVCEALQVVVGVRFALVPGRCRERLGMDLAYTVGEPWKK